MISAHDPKTRDRLLNPEYSGGSMLHLVDVLMRDDIGSANALVVGWAASRKPMANLVDLGTILKGAGVLKPSKDQRSANAPFVCLVAERPGKSGTLDRQRLSQSSNAVSDDGEFQYWTPQIRRPASSSPPLRRRRLSPSSV